MLCESGWSRRMKSIMRGAERVALFDRLGTRLAAAGALLFLLLVSATVLIVARGFDETRAVATTQSAAALEQQGRELLLQVTQREALLYATNLQRATEASVQAANAFVALNGRTPPGPWPAGRLVLDRDGQRYDPAPDRVTDVLLPPSIDVGGNAVAADVRDSAVLDAVLPVLIANSPDAVAIYFAAPSGVTRYYPPKGLEQVIAPEYDVRRDLLLTAATPEQNPNRAVMWRAPYVDDAGNGLLVTASAPIYDTSGFRGVVGIDVSLNRLIARLNDLRPTPNAHAFLLDGDGRLVAASQGTLTILGLDAAPETDTPIEVVGLNLFQSQPLLREVLPFGSTMTSGAAMLEFQGQPVALAYAGIPDPHWTLAVIAPLEELTGPVGAVTAAIGNTAETTVRSTVAIIGLYFALALAGIVLLNRHWLTQPIAALVEATEALGSGTPVAVLPVTRRDELGVLAESFNRMAAELAASRQELETRVAERTGELSAILAIGQRVALANDLEQTLATLAQSVVEGARAEACVVAVINADAPNDLSITTYGLPPNYIEIGNTIPDPDEEYNVWAQAIKTQQPVIVRNVREIALSNPTHAPIHPIMRSVAWDTVVCVPLTYQDRPLGTLSTYYRPEQQIDEPQLSFLRAVADQATIAVENARLFRQARDTAAVLERQKLARELHDSVSQALYGIALGAQTAQAHLIERPEAAVQPMEYVLSLAKAGMAEMRALIFELRPESLEQEGLVAALGKQADALRARHRLHVELTAGAEPAIALPAKEALYRIAQEAMHNIVKHAEARHVAVTLETCDSHVALTIKDDGVGFNAGGSFPGHLGLVSMRERMERLGGNFTLASALGEGTCVQVRVPLR